jgi:hypothetical protein
VSTSELVNNPTAPTVEWRGLKGVRGVSEADVTAPTDPASVDVMTGCYNAANNKTPRAESPTPMERLRVTRTHADGAVLRCAYHGLKAQGYVRTPFHGGRIAGWKLVNSLTKIPIRLDARAANVVSVTAKVGGQNA